ncbi:MAG: PEGA domain-containing protein [Candidatus Doudnabacteria bacterium]|nr:PEGA domain-containing protein [Candidatus Doudnabacteria bacterium]
MAKSFRILILLLIAVVCAVWSPWNYWNFSITRLFGIEPPPEIGGLQVTSLAGEVEVFVDGISQGKAVAEQAPLIIPAVEPGERQITLKRASTVIGAYWEFNRLVKFESGVDVIISYELGPSQDFSEGHVIFATKSADKFEGVKLNLDSPVAGAAVFLDDVEIGQTPLRAKSISIDKQHTIKVVAEGYETQEFKLLPEDQTNRDKISGFDLNVTVDLFLQPITVR